MIEIDPNTIVKERFLEFFKEIHLKKQPNLNELVISVQNYCEQLNSGRVKYLRDKILLISENIDSKSLDLEQKKLLSYIKTFLDSYSQVVKKTDSDILDEIDENFKNVNPSVTDEPIHLKLNKEEILGIITLFINEFSKEKISNERIFRLCAQNFRANASTKPNKTSAFSKTYYQKVNEKNYDNKMLFTQDTKNIVFEKLEKLSSSLANY